MKKTTLILFISSLLIAKSQIYFGTGYTYNSETLSYDNSDKSLNNNGARIKLGYGDKKAYAIEFSIDYLDITKQYLSDSDKYKLGFNVELLKAFDFGIYVNPFLKAGFGAGYMDTTADTYNNSLTYGSYNLGSGLFIPINEHFDIEVAYEYKNISYQKVDANLSYSPNGNLHTGYIGLNFRY